MSALKAWGVPFAPLGGSAWPVPAEPRIVPYTRADGTVVGNAATRFGAVREDGKRRHAGVDLLCAPSDRVVAIGPGTVLGQIPGFVRLGAVVVDHGFAVAVYAEIALDSLVRAGLAPGRPIVAGQFLGVGAENDSGRSMLHFELWAPGHAPAAYTPWWIADPPPAGLFDPTRTLLALAHPGAGADTAPAGGRRGLVVGLAVGAAVAFALGVRP